MPVNYYKMDRDQLIRKMHVDLMATDMNSDKIEIAAVTIRLNNSQL